VSLDIPPVAEPGLSNHHTLAAGWGRARRSTNLPLLPPRDRHQPQADRSGQPLREAVLSWPGSSPLPRSVGLGSFPPIIGRRLRRGLSAPSPKKRLIQFHLVLPCGYAVVFGSGRSRRHYHSALQPYIWILPGNSAPFGGKASAEPGVRTSQGFSVSLAQP
jgi:hypothetical protein